MLKNFLSISDGDRNAPISQQAVENPPPNREPLKHLLIGSPKTVSNTIQGLHALGYAEVGAWSPLLPTANPGEVISILIRYILVK